MKIAKIILPVLAVLIIGFVGGALLFGPKDQALIEEALDESIRASRQGSAGGVLDYLSRNLTYDGMPVGNKQDIARVVRSMRPDIVVLDRQVQMEGENTAKIVSPVTFKPAMQKEGEPTRIDNVTIVFRKESGTRWGVIPYPKWRIVEVRADGFDPASMFGDIL